MLGSLLERIPLLIMITGALVGIAGTLVGSFLVLSGRSMLSDAISHSIILGIVVVWLITGQQTGPIQTIGAAVTGLLTVFVTQALVRTRRMRNDAAIGLVFPVFFALGVLLLNLYARDVHIDEHTVLLGEIGFIWLDNVTLAGFELPRSLVAMSLITLVNLVFVALFYKELKLATFDPMLARALGFAPGVLSYGLLLLTSVTAVAAFDAVGVILFVAFVIVPPATAYLLTERLWLMLVIGCLVSVFASVIGYILANHWDVSIGGMMAVMTGAAFSLAFVFGPQHGLIPRWWRGRRRAAESREAIPAATSPNRPG
jgi:manganese/zinc/iron transport system permease protein